MGQQHSLTEAERRRIYQGRFQSKTLYVHRDPIQREGYSFTGQKGVRNYRTLHRQT
jgi:hypothetical protein